VLKTDPNLKLPQKTVESLKEMNNSIYKQGFDNIKILNAIAVSRLHDDYSGMSVAEFYALVIDTTFDLQEAGIVKENARSIGNITVLCVNGKHKKCNDKSCSCDCHD
jgi:hypothetical protein